MELLAGMPPVDATTVLQLLLLPVMGPAVAELMGLVMVQGQSVMVSVVAELTVYVLLPIEKEVAYGQYVVYLLTTSVV